jgi:hypothetical protein
MSALDIPIRIAIRMTVRLMPVARSYPLNDRDLAIEERRNESDFENVRLPLQK